MEEKQTYMSASSSLLLVSAENEVPRLRSVSSSVLHMGKCQLGSNTTAHNLYAVKMSLTDKYYTQLKPQIYLHVPIPVFDFLHVYNPPGL